MCMLCVCVSLYVNIDDDGATLYVVFLYILQFNLNCFY